MSDESAAVLKWLDKHGYPFELHVGQVLREAKWDVDHGTWYKDSQTGKIREIDVRATFWAIDQLQENAVVIELVIECKMSRDKPWVVFSAPRHEHQVLFRRSRVDTFSDDSVLVAVEAGIPIPDFVRQHKYLAHGIVRAHSDNKGGDPTAPYAALQSVMSAALERGRENARRSLVRTDRHIAHIVLPTVVVDGALYEYSLDSSDQPTLSSRDAVAISLAGPKAAEPVTIPIVTREGLRTYVAQLTNDANSFANALLPHAAAVCKSLRERVERVGRENAL